MCMVHTQLQGTEWNVVFQRKQILGQITVDITSNTFEADNLKSMEMCVFGSIICENVYGQTCKVNNKRTISTQLLAPILVADAYFK